MHRYDLFQPLRSRLPVPTAYPERFQFDQLDLPVATYAYEQEAIWLGEAIFRSGKEGVDQAVAAIAKVYRHRAALAAAQS
jgi:hypothetical protein